MMLNLDKSTWQRVKFGDVVKNANAKAPDPASDGIDRVIAMEHLDPGQLAVRRWGTLESGTTFTRRVAPGQTLFGKRRAYQRKVAFAEFNAICSGDILTFEAIPGMMLPEFLPFVVQSDPFFEKAVGTSAGSLSPRTNWRDLAKFEFDLPPLDQQKRIAILLWSVETHARAITDLVEDAKTSSDLLRDKFLGRYSWDSNLGEFLTGITAGRSFAASPNPASEETFGVLKVSAVGERAFIPSENKELLDQSRFEQRFSVRRGDLLITRANTSEYVGRAAIVRDDLPNIMLSDKTLRLEVDPSKSSVEFVFEFLRASRTRANISSVATGTGAAMKNISQKQVMGLPMPALSLDEQASFISDIQRFHDAEASLEGEQDAMTAVNSSLLTVILGGS